MFSWLFGNKDKARKFYEQAKEFEKQAKIFKENKKKSKECYETALYYINEAIRLNPEYATMPQIHAFKGELDYSNNNIELALHDFKKAIELDPHNPEYHGDIAQIYLDLGEYANAIEHINFAVRTNPLNKAFRKLLNEIEQKIIESQTTTQKEVYSQEQIKQNNKNLTETDVNEYSNNHTSEEAAKEYYKEGRVYFNDKSYDNAFECFKKAVEADSCNDYFIYWCGMAKFEDHKYDLAIDYFDKAIDIKPLADYYYQRGLSRCYTGDFQNAINDLIKGIEKKPKNVYIYYEYIADIKRKTGDLEGAVENYKFALECYPPQTESKKIQKKLGEAERQLAEEYFTTGKKYFDENNYDQSIEYFNKTIQINPLPEGYYYKAKANFCNNDYQKAIDDCSAGIKYKPVEDIWKYYELRADAKLKRGNLGGAKQDYNKALEHIPTEELRKKIQENIDNINKHLAEGFFATGKEYYEKEDYDNAIKNFDKAKNLDPQQAEYHYFAGLAKYWADEGYFEAAIKDFDKAIALDPKNPEYYYWCGGAKYYNGQKEEAIKYFTQGINLNPEDIYKYYKLMADAKKEIEDLEGSYVDYHKALENNPPEADANKIKEKLENIEKKIAENYYNGGHIHFANEDYEKAIECFKMASNMDIDNPEYYYWCGGAKYLLDNYPEAIEDFDMAIALDPKNPEYYYWCGGAKYLLDNYYEAIEYFTQGINLNPEDIYKYYEERAYAEDDAGYCEKAKEDYLRALENTSDEENCKRLQEKIEEITKRLEGEKSINENEEIIIDLEDLYEEQGNENELETVDEEENNEVITDYDQNSENVTELFDDNEEDNINTNIIEPNEYGESNNVDQDNEDNYEETKSAEEYYNIGKKHFDKKDYEEALINFENASDLDRDNPVYCFWCGYAAYKNELYDEAIYAFNNAIKHNPDNADYHYYCGLAHYWNEQDEAAIKDFNRAIELNPDNADYHYYCGLAHYWNDQDEAAIKDFNRAIKLNLDNASYHYYCGMAKYRTGLYKESIENYTRGIDLEPEDVYEYYKSRGDSKFKSGDLYGAQEDYIKALDNPDEEICEEINKIIEKINSILKNMTQSQQSAKTYFDTGEKLRKEKDYENAFDYYKLAVNAAPDNDKYYYRCGLMKYQIKQDEEAIEYFDKAINIKPKSEYYLYRGHAKYLCGDFDGAIIDFNAGIHQKPKEIYYFYEYKGIVKKELGDIEGARRNFYKALDAVTDPNIQSKIQEKLDSLDTDNTSKKEQVVSIENQSRAEKFFDRAKNLYDRKESFKATSYLERAIKLNPDNSEYYYWLAITYLTLRWNKQALEAIEKALELCGNKAEYYKLAGDVCKTCAGEEKEAESEYYERKANEYYERFENCAIVEQDFIYAADKNKSFLVNAGPGTGKTYTLVQKIKYLLEQYKEKDEENKIEEDNILVLSHTNAAVNEIKNRLKNISSTNINVNKINIRTICSFVKYAHSKIDEYLNKDKEEKDKKYFVYEASNEGFTKANEKLIFRMQFDYNFKKLLKELNIKYLIVDEIQDAVDSVGTIIYKLVEACIESDELISFALFGDECQAIYDFDKKNSGSKKNNEKYSLKSTEFYAKIRNLLVNKENIYCVSLEKNMRQQSGLVNFDNFNESLKEYRSAILKNDLEKCNQCLNKIKDQAPDNLSIEDSDISDNSTHCILTHSNNKALYIASKLRKEGIPVYARIADNNIQFEYHEWIGKILSHKWDEGYIEYDAFEEFITKNKINLPVNYEGYKEDCDEENHIKTFFEYLKNEILDKSEDEDISVKTLSDKIYYEYKCDSIFKCENECNIEVSTIHKAKGREFDCIHIESKCCEFGSKKSKEEQLNTNKNMYVALTRPRKLIDFVEFKNVGNIYKHTFYRMGDNYSIKEYQILYQNINYNSFNNEEFQNNLSDVKINDKIILENKGNGDWDIICNEKTIGQMEKMDDYYRFGIYPAKNSSNSAVSERVRSSGKIKQITGLCVDGIWSVFDKKENGDIIVWNVVSFCGFGDVVWEKTGRGR